MRMMRLAILSAGLLALLAGCMPVGGVRAEDPDATFDFDAGWKDVAPCAREQLAATFAGAQVERHSDFAEITVVGNYGGSTVMIVEIKDVTPGKARAAIHAHDYMLLWGGPVDRAVKALEKCKNPPQPAAPAPGG
jgi:poly-gamma-glutamate capsule biosynthesis protein CapA/YwtB (metallophosphatase superfamily)